MYLRFGHRVIVEALKNDPLAKIAIPSNEEIALYKEAIGAIYPLLSDLVSTMPTREEQRLDLQRKRQATSMRQAAEWGMRAIQSSFPCLKDTFVYEDTGERRILMKMLCLLYNLRARSVGINQIKNVFMKQLEEDANNEVGMM